jgi:hypothetical protein
MTGEARANTFLRVFGRVCPLVLREDAGVVPDGAVSAEGLLQMTPGTFRFDLLSRPQRGRTFVLCDVDPTCRAYFALPFDGVYGPPEAERARLMTFLEAFAALRASPGLVSLFAFDVQLRARYVARWDSGEELTVQESLLYDAAFDRLRPPGCASPPKTTAPLPSEAHDPSARRVLLPEIALERDPRGRVRVLVGGRPIPMLLERTRSGTTNSGGYHDVLSTARVDWIDAVPALLKAPVERCSEGYVLRTSDVQHLAAVQGTAVYGGWSLQIVIRWDLASATATLDEYSDTSA